VVGLISILCDVIADLADVNMMTHWLTSDDRTLICGKLRVEKGWGALDDERISFKTMEMQYFERFD